MCGRVQHGHSIPGDQRILEQIIRKLLDLPGLRVDLIQVIVGLFRRFVLAAAQDLGIQQQGGQRRAQVVRHFGDEVFHLSRCLRLLFLLLAQSYPHGIQTGRQRGDLIAAADGNGMIQIAALHGLDLLAELHDVAHDPAAVQQEEAREPP